MLILTLRTDNPQAEIGLYEDEQQLGYYTWQAHRLLAETINVKIVDILQANHKHLHELQGLAVFKGPGSFTGLRIGMTVANALAYALNIPVIASQDDMWLEDGLRQLLAGQNDRIAMPEYGALPNITAPKH